MLQHKSLRTEEIHVCLTVDTGHYTIICYTHTYTHCLYIHCTYILYTHTYIVYIPDPRIVRIQRQHRLAHVYRLGEPATAQATKRQLKAHGCRGLELELPGLYISTIIVNKCTCRDVIRQIVNVYASIICPH